MAIITNVPTLPSNPLPEIISATIMAKSSGSTLLSRSITFSIEMENKEAK